MIDYHSKVTGEHTHRIVRVADQIRSGRDHNWSPKWATMQVSSKQLSKGDSYRPHRHIGKIVPPLPTGECWVVMKGVVEITCYDVNEMVLGSVVLYKGDIAITFGGGHGYKGVAKDSLIVEPKSGPFFGNKQDKEYIE